MTGEAPDCILLRLMNTFSSRFRMHPRENPELWVFVTGGITADEVASIRQVITESSSSCRLVIGATKLTSPEETLKSLFVKSPLLTC